LLDLGFDAVLEDRFAFGDLPQGLFAAGFLELLETIEAVAGIAQDLAGLGDVAQLSGQFQQAHFVLDDLLFGRHV
jgi:hypothetical protein